VFVHILKPNLVFLVKVVYLKASVYRRPRSSSIDHLISYQQCSYLIKDKY